MSHQQLIDLKAKLAAQDEVECLDASRNPHSTKSTLIVAGPGIVRRFDVRARLVIIG